ncbi:MAG: hypothetical protein R6T83_09240 [Salinibacter sp.]
MGLLGGGLLLAGCERPDFVKEGYPDDRAYGFEPGDLRGIYAVFVPDPSGQES